MSVSLALALAAITARPVDRPKVESPLAGMVRPELTVARRSGPLTIDGRHDEADWQRAEPGALWFQREPNEGHPATYRTEFRVLYDDDTVYVGVRAYYSRPAEIEGFVARRDDDKGSSDWVFIYFDSYHDRRTAFTFAVNAAGVQGDALIYDDVKWDWTWDAVWRSATAIDDLGWTAEYAIPLSQLRFRTGQADWGFQIARITNSKEVTFWAPWPNAAAGRVSLFGELHGLGDLEPRRTLQVTPYVLGGAASGTGSDGAIARAGLDARYGVGSNLTLAATINPDFGQVEADPSVLNLTDSEVFLPERRGFFLEGAEMFRVPLSLEPDGIATDYLFHSRRIGAMPHTGSGGDPTSIYAASKLSGKSASGLSVGAMTALTAQEKAPVADEMGVETDRVSEPLTSYSVLRVEQDFDGGRGAVGGAMTAVHRSLDGTDLGWLHDRAYAGALSSAWRAAPDWNARLTLLGSWVHGTPEAITRTQTSSVHYYQRADASHVELDPMRESLTGYGAAAQLLKDGGTTWRGGGGADVRSPGLELNDLGYLPTVDHVMPWAWLQYRRDTPAGPFLAYQLNARTFAFSTFEPRLTQQNYNGNVNLSWRNHWATSAGATFVDGRWDTRALRGGPALRSEDSVITSASVSTDDRADLIAKLSTRARLQPRTRSRSGWAELSLSLRAADRVEVGLAPSFEARVEDTQYIGEVDDGAAMRHYLVGRIDQKTLATTLRVGYGFSPTMTLQAYAQPFVSAGRYLDHREAVDPAASDRSDRFRSLDDDISRDGGDLVVDANGDGAEDYRFGDPSFVFRELRSNLVYRWEYRPGSALFVIWTHAGSGRTPGGTLAGDDVASLFDDAAADVVLVKLTYWATL